MTAKKGWGYYDISTYPYGGDFHRLASDTKVKVVKDWPKNETEVILPNGRHIVITNRALTHENPPLGKWQPVKAVRFNANGSVSLRVGKVSNPSNAAWGVYQDGKGLISKHKTHKSARSKWDKLVQAWTRKTGGSRFTGNNPYWVEQIKGS